MNNQELSDAVRKDLTIRCMFALVGAGELASEVRPTYTLACCLLGWEDNVRPSAFVRVLVCWFSELFIFLFYFLINSKNSRKQK